MSDQSERLKFALQADGGGAECAIRAVLTSELNILFRQYMNVDAISLKFDDGGITVRIEGDGLKKAGHCAV